MHLIVCLSTNELKIRQKLFSQIVGILFFSRKHTVLTPYIGHCLILCRTVVTRFHCNAFAMKLHAHATAVFCVPFI